MQNHRLAKTASLSTALLLASCAGGAGPAPVGSGIPARATEAEWEVLAAPREQPLADAARVAVADFQFVGTPFTIASPVDSELGLAELVAAGLLRRADVQWVERRRFTAAAEAERRGEQRPEGAPAAGTSPGVEFLLSGTWADVGLDSAYLDLRLADAASGSVVKSWRTSTAERPDPTALARAVVGSLLVALDDIGRRPLWTDPVAGAAPAAYRGTDIPPAAVEAFFGGLAAEDLWDWESARRGYQEAIAHSGGSFPEAEAALARAARLRNGGTLGGSE